MCNLYSTASSQDEIRKLFRVLRDIAGNIPLLFSIFPDYIAPIVRIAGGEKQLEMMRWGMPSPPQ
jgi:putative SOS response-associated peptidase YedK